MSRETVKETQEYYDDLGRHGAFGPIVPDNRGKAKSRYVAAVLDAALLPLFRRETSAVRLLDFGCGTGIFTAQVQPMVETVVGVDISPGLLDVARGVAAGIPLVRYDGLRLPFRDGAFNRVVARESLCHVPDESIPAVLGELARVTEAAGMVYHLEQVSESPRWQRQEEPGWPWHRRRAVEEWEGLFRRAGFEKVSSVPVRQPRFPWIYPIWFGLVPSFAVPPLARMEVAWNRHFCRLRTRRWIEALFVFRRLRRED